MYLKYSKQSIKTPHSKINNDSFVSRVARTHNTRNNGAGMRNRRRKGLAQRFRSLLVFKGVALLVNYSSLQRCVVARHVRWNLKIKQHDSTFHMDSHVNPDNYFRAHSMFK